MAINIDPHREPRRYENKNTAVWVVVALLIAGLVVGLIYMSSADAPETTGPAAVTVPATPETTPSPNP